jgi:DNA-binding GntR family transcriptional regulator
VTPRERTLQSLEIHRNSLAGQAYAKLREAIVTGMLRPGERLVERQLGLQMGASRTPLREAMIRLVHEGMLTALPSGGHVVSSIDEHEARDLYEIRIALEGYACRLAAERATAETIEELRSFARLEHKRLNPVNLRELEDLNNLFHRTLYASAGRPRMFDLIEIHREQALHYRIYEIYKPDEVVRGVRQHDEIIDAVERRDGDLAERLMRRHITQGAAIVLERRVAPATSASQEKPWD